MQGPAAPARPPGRPCRDSQLQLHSYSLFPLVQGVQPKVHQPCRRSRLLCRAAVHCHGLGRPHRQRRRRQWLLRRGQELYLHLQKVSVWALQTCRSMRPRCSRNTRLCQPCRKYLDNKCEEDSYTPIVRTSGNNTWFGYLQITATRTKLTVEAQRVPWTCTDCEQKRRVDGGWGWWGRMWQPSPEAVPGLRRIQLLPLCICKSTRLCMPAPPRARACRLEHQHLLFERQYADYL